MTTPNQDPPENLAQLIENAKTQLEHIIDVSPQGILLTDHAGKIVRVNQSLLDLLSKEAFSDVLGESLFGLFPAQKESGEDFTRDLVASALESPAPVTQEVELSLPGRGPCVLHFTLMSSAGAPEELIVVMVEDVTDRKLAEQAREREQRTAASRAIIAALLHELNQPLTVVMVRANLLRMASAEGNLVPEDLVAGLEDIVQQATLASDKLARAEKLRDFVDEPYTDGTPDLRIVDFELSADAEQQRTRLLIVEGGAEATRVLVEAEDAHLELFPVASVDEADEMIASEGSSLDIILLDTDFITEQGGTLPDLSSAGQATVLVIATNPGSDLATEVVSAGALDVLTKPLTDGHLMYAIQRAIRHRQAQGS